MNVLEPQGAFYRLEVDYVQYSTCDIQLEIFQHYVYMAVL